MNRQDAERLVALADPELEVQTPHGIERGHNSVRSFVERQSYGVAQVIEPTRIFARNDVAVVFGRTDFRSVDTGETMGSQIGGVLLELRNGRVVRLALHDDLVAALSEAGLDEHEDAVPL